MSDERKECFGIRTISEHSISAGHNYRNPKLHMHRFDDSVVEAFTALAKHLLGPCEVWVYTEWDCEHWVYDPHLDQEVPVEPFRYYALHATDLATRRKLLVPSPAGERVIRHPRLKASACVVQEYDDD